jgi:hypothetical protein
MYLEKSYFRKSLTKAYFVKFIITGLLSYSVGPSINFFYFQCVRHHHACRVVISLHVLLKFFSYGI